MNTPNDASTREISSTARTDIKKLPAPPPNSSGMWIPINPKSNNSGMTLGSSFASSSILRTSGLIRPSAKDRQESRNNCSSSDKAVNGSFICVYRPVPQQLTHKKIEHYIAGQEHRL